MSRLFASLIDRTTRSDSVLARRRPARFEAAHGRTAPFEEHEAPDEQTETPAQRIASEGAPPVLGAHGDAAPPMHVEHPVPVTRGRADTRPHAPDSPLAEKRRPAAQDGASTPQLVNTVTVRKEIEHHETLRTHVVEHSLDSASTSRRIDDARQSPTTERSNRNEPPLEPPARLRANSASAAQVAHTARPLTRVESPEPPMRHERTRRAPIAQPLRHEARNSAPTVQVTIGRIEVRASTSKAEAKPKRPPRPTLEDYLRSRSGGAR